MIGEVHLNVTLCNKGLDSICTDVWHKTASVFSYGFKDILKGVLMFTQVGGVL